MKFNWGTGILISIILFVSAGIGFIIFAFQYDVNLVHEEYYKKGVNYNQEMLKAQRSAKFENSIYIENNSDKISIIFPDNFSNGIANGEVLFFRPSDRFKDYKIDLNISNGYFRISQPLK